jgi:phosphoribosylformimino-5-aminoimidazole carboxamide ribonucleotide (ProFAR) isomerase
MGYHRWVDEGKVASLKILPTLNIQNGLAVPFSGSGGQARNPAQLVEELIGLGCHRLALVDVDAAAGSGHNRDLIAGIMRQFHRNGGKVCIQVGGGIRSSDQAQFFLDRGATWILVGTIILSSPLVVDQLLARFRDHLTAGVDARSGRIQASGWREPAPLSPETVGLRIRDHGFKRILFTDIPCDRQACPDFATARVIAQTTHVPLFMGGSVQSRLHLKAALEVPGLQGIAMDASLLMQDPELLGTLNPVHTT